MATVRLPASVREAMAAHARAAYPAEACGLLLGSVCSDGNVCIDRAVCAANVAPDPRRWYTIDPATHLRTQREARAAGLEIVGYFHSHPDAEARPSKHDLAEAWPVVVYLIVSVRQGEAGEARAWRLDEAAGSFRELDVT